VLTSVTILQLSALIVTSLKINYLYEAMAYKFKLTKYDVVIW